MGSNTMEKKQKEKRTLFFVWEAIAILLFGLAASCFLGPVMGFGILCLVAAVLYFPVKILLKEMELF